MPRPTGKILLPSGWRGRTHIMWAAKRLRRYGVTARQSRRALAVLIGGAWLSSHDAGAAVWQAVQAARNAAGAAE